jgi:hypothetical protein
VDEFKNFLYSFGAARNLLDRAFNVGSLIEGLVLYVSLVDGLLRIALILHIQIDTGGQDFDFSYIQQERGKRRYSERQIYEEAFQRDLINADLKNEIEELYETRNAFVHRFFLTSVRYVDLGSTLDRYESVYHRCYDLVNSLEEQQLQTGRGMTTTGPASDRRKIADEINSKLGFGLAKPRDELETQ